MFKQSKSWLVTTLILAGIIGILTFIFLQKKPETQNASILGVYTLPATPTPTPRYLSYINQPANYVGEIESVDSTEKITLVREDQSRIILELKPEVPIFHMRAQKPQIEIQTLSVKELKPGNILSIFSRDKDILAIFIQ